MVRLVCGDQGSVGTFGTIGSVLPGLVPGFLTHGPNFLTPNSYRQKFHTFTFMIQIIQWPGIFAASDIIRYGLIICGCKSYMVLGLTAKGLFRQEKLVHTWFGHEPFAGVSSITERVEEPGA